MPLRLLPLGRLMEDGGGCAYDNESLAIIKLNNTTVLYLKEVTKFLALVCILREESFERKGEWFLDFINSSVGISREWFDYTGCPECVIEV